MRSLRLTGGFGALIILLMTQDGVLKLTPTQFAGIGDAGALDGGAGSIIACLSTLFVLWVAIRMAGREFDEYLALNWPSWKELLLAFARWQPAG